MLSKPTRGDFTCGLTACTNCEPMMANCNKCSGVLSMLAPKSNTQVKPPSDVGKNLAIAGRSMPSMVFKTNFAVAINAPVLPADTAASAKPSFTWLMATRIEESFLWRKALRGSSSMSTTSEACITLMRSIGAFTLFNAACNLVSSPTISNLTSFWRSKKATEAGTVTLKPMSPPIASTAIVIIFLLNHFQNTASLSCDEMHHKPDRVKVTQN